MPPQPSDGIASLAHAIRRGVALYVAAITSEAGTSTTDMLATADQYATWLLGKAGAAEEQRQPAPPLGVPFDEARGV